MKSMRHWLLLAFLMVLVIGTVFAEEAMPVSTPDLQTDEDAVEPIMEIPEEEVPADFSVEDEVVLMRGSNGWEVTQVQTQLNRLGYDVRTIDGGFGAATEQAVREFQRLNGLEETGVVTQSMIELLASDEAVGVGETYVHMNLLRNSGYPLLSEERYPVESNDNYLRGVWRKTVWGTGESEVILVQDAPVSGIVNGIHIVARADSENATDVAIDNIPVKYGEVYILSCYAKGSGSFHILHGKDPWYGRQFELTEEWQQYSCPFQIGFGDGSTKDNPTTRIFFGIPGRSESDIYLCGFKLERVNATSWSAGVND